MATDERNSGDDEPRPAAPAGAAPPSLTYRDGRADRPGRARQQLEATGAAGLALLAVVACVVVWVMSNLQLGQNPPPLNWLFPTLCSAAALLGLGALGAIAWRRGKRHVTLGLMVGLGVGLLCEGVCFAVLLT